jgi:uncharacterized damage-inducible protein DinB
VNKNSIHSKQSGSPGAEPPRGQLNYKSKPRGDQILVELLYNAFMPPVAEIETLKQKLAVARARLLDVCKPFSPAALAQPASDGWSVNDILAHVANAEKINVKFARLMLGMDKPIQVQVVAADYPDYAGAFELDRFNAYMLEKLRGQTYETPMRALEETRAATLAWLDELSAADLERKGAHAAWGEQSVRGILKILILHDKMHAQQIEKRGKVAKERGG